MNPQFVLQIKTQNRDGSHISVVFKLCAAALWGAVRNLRGAANFFRNKKYSSLSIEIWLIFQLNAAQCSL
jgi:hypothetical protein